MADTGGASTHHFHAHKLFNMEGWVCVVTGGGTGIGLVIPSQHLSEYVELSIVDQS